MSLKRVIFLKIWISEFLGFFWTFPEFILILIPLKMAKRGLYLHRTRGADVARETRADATWHARPRGSATQTHARRWRERVAGPR